MEIQKILQQGLVVSCQATSDSPLRDTGIMVAMARAAQMGGAVGIRADGPVDISAIRAAVTLPIIGIYKQHLPTFDVYITPTLEAARLAAAAGASLLAVDGTSRLRPGGMTAAAFVKKCKSELNLPVMADISTFEEAMAAAEAGADLVATTLTGFTPYSQPVSLPDFELVERLVKFSPVPVVVEGHVSTPEEARLAFDLGVYAVVVGAAITQPQWITRRFVDAINQSRDRGKP
jgi:N-acylglucosamine-6-phosphate 2-epimerase